MHLLQHVVVIIKLHEQLYVRDCSNVMRLQARTHC